MVREYEAMYILRPELDEDGVKSELDAIHELVENGSGTVDKTTRWGRRHLAYEIEGYQEGYYIIDRFHIEGTALKEMERTLHINEQVLRHLIVLSSTTTDMSVSEGAGGERTQDEDESESPARTPRAARDDDEEEEEEE